MKAYRFTYAKPEPGRKQPRHPCGGCGKRGLGLPLKLDTVPGLVRECRYCKAVEPAV